MGKRSVVYETGERLTPDTVTNVPTFTRYAQQELGLSLPLGNGRRQGWMGFCKEEMAVQSWTIPDLVAAVDYIKAKRRECRTLHGILWYVDEAVKYKASCTSREADDSLHLKVAKALATEEDEGWARKLSLASGKALELVYASWEQAHGQA